MSNTTQLIHVFSFVSTGIPRVPRVLNTQNLILYKWNYFQHTNSFSRTKIVRVNEYRYSVMVENIFVILSKEYAPPDEYVLK